MGERMKQADIARGLGLSGAAVTKLKKAGMPVHSLEAARAWREQRVRPRVKSKPAEAAPAEAGHVSLHEAKRREALAKATMLERENLKQAGELLPAAAVVERWQAILWTLRQKFLALPSRAAGELYDGATRAEVHAVMERLTLEALNEAADERCTP
jgi:hypothetical protein